MYKLRQPLGAPPCDSVRYPEGPHVHVAGQPLHPAHRSSSLGALFSLTTCGGQTTRGTVYLRDLWDNIICTNIYIIGVPEGEEREKGPEKLFEEILAENFPNMGKEIVNQVQDAQRVLGRINPRRNTQDTQ